MSIFACPVYSINVKIFPKSAFVEKFSRAYLEFYGVSDTDASYEARIFLNNPKAEIALGYNLHKGYVGSFRVFGHAGCSGDVGHCHVQAKRAYDTRAKTGANPLYKRVEVTRAIKKLASKSSAINVTIVPYITGGSERCDYEKSLSFDQIKLITV
ncbi:MAG: hypothetical protein V3V61_06535 [Gammaproteobacteria bacterium]